MAGLPDSPASPASPSSPDSQTVSPSPMSTLWSLLGRFESGKMPPLMDWGQLKTEIYGPEERKCEECRGKTRKVIYDALQTDLPNMSEQIKLCLLQSVTQPIDMKVQVLRLISQK
ncbi:uncharacterized protein LOC117147772 [Drosophila mauritiana]|uniref:Uncharacterized protein LOC117147772 n=1 Tax=Drosophila mauritiana TaxID=7226 RepID=A0A6P8KNR7_DROMA|nr:uncharacterized protein LOC117147772 [Drosophila mauritiana]